MSDEIFFDGAKYLSACVAGASADLTRDYVAKLSREGKIPGRRVGKNWYVEEAAFKRFLLDQEYSKEIRKKNLSEQRVREYHASSPGGQNVSRVPVVSAPFRKTPYARSALMSESIGRFARRDPVRNVHDRVRELHEKMLHSVADNAARAKDMVGTPGISHAALSAVHIPAHSISPALELLHKIAALAFTVVVVFEIYAFVDPAAQEYASQMFRDSVRPLAAIIGSSQKRVAVVAAIAQTQLAAAAENPSATAVSARNSFSDFFANLFKVAGQFRSSLAPVLVPTSTPTSSGRGFVNVQIVPRGSNTTSQNDQASGVSDRGGAGTTIINQPVIERIIERVLPSYTLSKEDFVTKTVLDERINQLDNALSSKIASISASQGGSPPAIPSNFLQVLSQSSRIDHLDGVTITNAGISGSTFSGSGVSTDALSVGGTATTSFAKGIDIAGGCFAVDGTCITGGGGGNSIADPFTHPASGQSATTSLILLNGAASSTLLSVFDRLFVGGTATTTIFGSATSTFGAGIQTTALDVTASNATSTFANGIQLSAGCFRLPDGSCAGTGSGGSSDAFTHTTYSGQSVSATSTGVWFTGSSLSLIASSTFFTYASTTAFTNSGATWLTALASSGLGVDANGKVYAAATTTAGSGITYTSGANTFSLNLSNANSWSGLQQFTNASTSKFSSYGTSYFGGTATTTIDTSGNLSVVGTLSVAGQTTLANASTSLLSAYGPVYFGATATSSFSSGGVLTLGTIASCTGGQALQTDGSGNVSCGTVSAGGSASGGGWTATGGSVNGNVSLSTTTYLVAIGATSTPYAKLAVLSGSTATTTLALVPVTSQTANILDIYDTSGNLASVLTASHKLGIGTTSPWALLSVNPNGISGPAFAVGSSSATNFVVTNAGKVGIATSSPSSNYAFSVNGAGYFSSGVTLGTPLAVASGGTGWAAVQSGAVLYGNGSGALSTTTAGTNGFVLALSGDTPTWVATTSLTAGTGITTTLNGNTWTITNTAPTIGDPFTHPAAGQSATTSLVLLNGAASSTQLSVYQKAYFGGTATSSFDSAGALTLGGLTSSGLGVDASGKVYAAPTSTLSTISGTLALSQLATQAANTVLVNQTAGAAAPTALATSTFGSTLFGTGSNGQVLSWNGGLPSWVATTTFSAGTGISLALAGNTWTITNTAPTIGDPFTHTSYAAQTTSATTSTLWLTGPTISLAASSSVLTYASSTAFTVSNSAYLATTGGSVGVATTSPWGLISINGNAIGTNPQFVVGSSTATNFLVDQGGKVGVATTSPSSNFAFGVTGVGYLQYASTTALSATTFCLTGDTCRTTWPSGGTGIGDPFTHPAAGQSATTSLALFFGNASTTELTATSSVWFTGLTGGAGGLAIDSNGKLYSGATSTLSTISGTLALSQLATQAANTVLVNQTAGAAAPTALATSTFGSTLFGTGSNGQVLSWNGGLPSWVATTTFSAGTGISLALAGNTWTITNTAPTIGDPFTHTASGQSATTSLVLLNGAASSTQLSVYQKAYFGGTATSSFDSAGALTLASALTVANGGTGGGTFTAGSLLFGSGTNAFGSVATGTLTAGTGLALDNSTRSLVGGSAQVSLASIAANSILANQTAGAAAPTALATSTFGSTLYGTGSAGQVLYWPASGVPTWIATTSLTAGAGITTTLNGNTWTITNTGASFSFPFTTLTTFGTTSAATSSSIATAGVFYASSTAAASQFPYASSTAVTTGTLFDTSITSALALFDSTHKETAYSGSTCTNQFVRSLNGAGVATCATVSLTADVTGTLPIANGGTATTTFYNGGITFYNSTLGTLSQGTAAADFFYDVANKRLGLGTSTPWAQLSVNSNAIGSTPQFVVGSSTATQLLVDPGGHIGVGTTSPWALVSINPDDTINNLGTKPFFVIGSSTATNFIVSNTGNVGIGSTSPLSLLSIQGNANATVLAGVWGGSTSYGMLSLNGGTSTGANFYSGIADQNLYINRPTGKTINFRLNNADQMVLGSGGSFGIGSTTPGSLLSVQNVSSLAQATIAYDTSNYTNLLTSSAGDFFMYPSGKDLAINNGNLWVCTGGSAATIACPSGAPSTQGNIIAATAIGIATSTPNWALEVAGTRPSVAISDTGAGGLNLKHWLLSSMGGNLYIGTSTDLYATTTPSFLTVIGAQGSGAFGIGTSTPAQQLAVQGKLFVGNGQPSGAGTATSTFQGDLKITGKLDVPTIDPVYTIDGTKYATYGQSSIGVHEETLQTIELSEKDSNGKYVYEIPFDSLERGSDLWLFWQITDFGEEWKGLVVSLTPSFDGNVFYKKVPAEHKLLIYADEGGEVSMRLSGPRFDFTHWQNLRTDQEDTQYKGFEIDSKSQAAALGSPLP